MRRWTLAMLPLLAIAAPIPAQAADVRDAAEALTDPVESDRMASTVTALVDALMRTNIGPLAEAIARVDERGDGAGHAVAFDRVGQRLGGVAHVGGLRRNRRGDGEKGQYGERPAAHGIFLSGMTRG